MENTLCPHCWKKKFCGPEYISLHECTHPKQLMSISGTVPFSDEKFGKSLLRQHIPQVPYQTSNKTGDLKQETTIEKHKKSYVFFDSRRRNNKCSHGPVTCDIRPEILRRSISAPELPQGSAKTKEQKGGILFTRDTSPHSTCSSGTSSSTAFSWSSLYLDNLIEDEKKIKIGMMGGATFNIMEMPWKTLRMTGDAQTGNDETKSSEMIIAEVQDIIAESYLAYLCMDNFTFLMESNPAFIFSVSQMMSCTKVLSSNIDSITTLNDVETYSEAFYVEHELSKFVLVVSENIHLTSKNLVLTWVHGVVKNKAGFMLTSNEEFMAKFDVAFYLKVTKDDIVQDLYRLIMSKCIGIDNVDKVLKDSVEHILADTSVNILLILECAEKFPEDFKPVPFSQTINCSVSLLVTGNENLQEALTQCKNVSIVKMQSANTLSIHNKRMLVCDSHEANILSSSIEDILHLAQKEHQILDTICFEGLIFDFPIHVSIPKYTNLRKLLLKNCSPNIELSHFAACLECIGPSRSLPYTQLLSKDLSSFVWQVYSNNGVGQSHIFFKEFNLQYFFKVCENLQEVSLKMIVGKQHVNVKFMQTEIKEMNEYLRNNTTLDQYYVKWFAHHFQFVQFDINDFNVERIKGNSYADEIILHNIGLKLKYEYDFILKVYPTMRNGKERTALVCYTNDPPIGETPSTFRGLAIIRRQYSLVSSESLIIENSICTDLKMFKDFFVLVNETVSAKIDGLMSVHSNLEAVAVSQAKSKNCQPVCGNKPIIILYCRYKSYVPYKEPMFPTQITHPFRNDIAFETDVREGYFIPCMHPSGNNINLQKRVLEMGCSVGTSTGTDGATLGPFIKFCGADGIDHLCFVTVCHLIRPWERDLQQSYTAKIITPSEADLRLGEKKPDLCGEIISAKFNEHVDAMLVKIVNLEKPTRGSFVVPKLGQLHDAGFSKDNFPTFDDGAFLDPTKLTTKDYATERIIKFGSESGLTKGLLNLIGSTVRCDVCTICDTAGTFKFKKHIIVESRVGNHFVVRGDSGAAVFVVDKQDKLFCIGIAIGTMTDDRCVVTPLPTILEHLKEEGCKIEMHKFEFEGMSHD